MSDSNNQVNAVMTSISDALGMRPLVVSADQPSTEMTVSEPLADEMSEADKQAEEDFATARANFHEILSKGAETLDAMLRIASASEHPRAFEVAANLIKTMTDANQNLLKLHEQRRQLVPVESKPAESTTNITQNNVFVGTFQDLLDKMDEHENGKVIDHDPS